MTRWMRRAIVLAFACFSASGVEAQRLPPARGRFFATVGPTLVAVRDDAASPLGYGGPGLMLAAGASGGAIGVAFRAAGAQLGSSLTAGGRPAEADVRLELDVEYLRRASTRWRVGARLTTHLAGRIHYYDDPSRQDAAFLFGTALLGPATEWRVPVSRGVITVQAAFTLGGLALRPWSDARVVVRGGQGPRFVALPTLLGGDARVEWAPRAAGALRLGYRLDVMRYHDVPRYRAVVQGVYVGMSLGEAP